MPASRLLRRSGLDRIVRAVGSAVAMAVLAAPAAAQPSWAPDLFNNSLTGSIVETSIVFDDGTGPALYVAGAIYGVAGDAAGGVIKWDGQRWTALPLLWYGPNRAHVYSMAVFNDGTGPALYVGGGVSGTSRNGVQTTGIARWDGSSWQSVGGGLSMEAYGTGGVGAMALHVHDDGTGPALYAAGSFETAGGQTCNGIAKWDGLSWHPLTPPGGAPGILTNVGHQVVFAMETFNGELYLAGDMPSLVKHWNGTTFQSAGVLPAPGARTLRVFQNALYAAVPYTGTTPGLFRWDGASWSTPISDLPHDGRSLTIFDDGSGPALFVGCEALYGGTFESSSMVVKWDGATAQNIGSGLHGYPSIYGGSFSFASLVPWNDGKGTKLHALGLIWDRPTVFKRVGGSWKSGVSMGEGGDMSTSIAADLDGPGPLPSRLYAISQTGVFGSTVPADRFADGGVRTGWVGEFDGQHWRVLGDALNANTHTLGAADLGAGVALYAGGGRLSRWSGAAWETVGSPTLADGGGDVWAITGFDPDGSGPMQPHVVIAGRFDSVDGVPASNIAQWDGTTWSALAAGTDDIVNQLAVFDDGSGPALYAAGKFLNAGGGPASGIAKWNGASWMPLGAGLDFQPAGDSIVTGLRAFSDSAGSGLAVAGSFTGAGGTSTPGLACWRASGWTAMSTGLSSNTPLSPVLEVWNDGGGAALYVGNIVGPVTGPVGNRQRASYIYKWDGTQWNAITGGTGFKRPALTAQTTTAIITSLAAAGSGQGSSLYATGSFGMVDDVPSSSIARWSEPAVCYANCDGSTTVPLLNANDFNCFLNKFAAGDSYANCDGSTTAPVLNANDFNCFLNQFAAGCT